MVDASINLAAAFIVRHTVPDPLKFEVFGEYRVQDLSSGQRWAISYPFQRKVWHANGRHWIFGIYLTDFQYWHSPDGQAWTGPVFIRDVVSYELGQQVSTWVDSEGYLHYSYSGGANNGDIFYRKGFLESNGSITWVAAEQTVYNPGALEAAIWPMITVDVNGYPWIAWYYLASGSKRVYVTKSDTQDGTWTTNPNYPARLDLGDSITYLATAYPLANGKVFVYFGGTGCTKWWGTLCDENGAEATDEANSAGDWDYWYVGGAIAVGNAIYAAYGGTDTLIYLNKWEGGSWGSEVIIQDVRANQCPTFFRIGDVVYVTWMDWVADEFRYKRSLDAGATWTPSGTSS